MCELYLEFLGKKAKQKKINHFLQLDVHFQHWFVHLIIRLLVRSYTLRIPFSAVIHPTAQYDLAFDSFNPLKLLSVAVFSCFLFISMAQLTSLVFLKLLF